MKLYEALNRAFRQGGTTAADAARTLAMMPERMLRRLLTVVGLPPLAGRLLRLEQTITEPQARALIEVVQTAGNEHFDRIWSEPLA